MTQTALARKDNAQGLAAVTPIDGTNKLAKLNMRELKELAEVFIQSGAFTDVKQTAQAMVKIIAGQELGFSPIVSMTGIHFFNGKVAIGANLLAALIKENEKYEYKITEHTNTACTLVFFQLFNGEAKQLGVPVRYTIEEARNAGLTGKDNWKKYPADMLFAACLRQGARRYCADILRGVTPDTETEHDSDIDRSAIDDAQITETIDGEVVENEIPPRPTSTHVDPPSPADEPSSDLLAEVCELIKLKIGGEEDDINGFLKGRDLSQMTPDALERMRADLAAM